MANCIMHTSRSHDAKLFADDCCQSAYNLWLKKEYLAGIVLLLQKSQQKFSLLAIFISY